MRGDTPLSGGTIRFTAEDPGFVASSPIGPDGTFSLETNLSRSSSSVAGVPGGIYTATVIMPAEDKRPPLILSSPDTYTIKYGGQEDLVVKLP